MSGRPNLRIAEIAPLWTSVPPRSYGGTERVVHHLTDELKQRGHEVTLFASGDSHTQAQCEPVISRSLIDLMSESKAFDHIPYHLSSLVQAMQDRSRFDIIHSHLGLSFLPVATLSQIPSVHTTHTAVMADETWILSRHNELWVSFVSHAQKHCAPKLAHSRVIYNCCDFSEFTLGGGNDNYLAFLGRMAPQKNPVLAVKIAQEVGYPIILAGEPMNPTEQEYFTSEVAPLINNTSVKYIGKVDNKQKCRLLGGAAAFLFPIDWEEPFGLVMIESMACGTPVVALSRGSVPEVVDEGVTGFTTTNPYQLARLVKLAVKLDRPLVRKQAEARFGVKAMVDGYEAMFLDAIGLGR